MSQLDTRTNALPAIRYENVPETLSAIINVEAWASSILRGTPYREPNPDFISIMLAWETMSAQTAEEAFRTANVRGLQKILPNAPDATTGPIEITDLYVAASDFETGRPTFLIITATDLTTGEEFKFTTGALNVQATIFALLVNRVWPIRCQIKRGETKDKGDRYLLFVLPPD